MKDTCEESRDRMMGRWSVSRGQRVRSRQREQHVQSPAREESGLLWKTGRRPGVLGAPSRSEWE